MRKRSNEKSAIALSDKFTGPAKGLGEFPMQSEIFQVSFPVKLKLSYFPHNTHNAAYAAELEA